MFTTIVIDPDLAARFPEAFVVSVHAEGLSSEALAIAAAETLAAGAQAASRTYAGIDDIAAIPAVRTWREAYRRSGVKPSRYRSSIEALIRRALRSDPPKVMPLVDIYNGLSLQHGVPMGAVDADRVPSGDIKLRLCRPERDWFEPLGGAVSDFPLHADLPVYALGDTVLCWCFNARDARPTALQADTRRAIFFSEGIEASQRDGTIAAMEALAALLRANGAAASCAVTGGP